MSDACHAGGRDALEIEIRRKVHVTVEGTAVVAIEDFALRVQAGGFVALIGPSGCGKTTILRIVAGLDRTFAGTVSKPDGMRLAVVFQEPRLLPWRTVAENVDLARPTSVQGATALLAERLGLDAVLQRYPSELSLGQARRVALARALAVEPRLLLLDEPFVSLDAASGDRMRDAVADFAQGSGATVLMVTHDLTEAIDLADTLVILTGRPAKVQANFPLPSPRGRRAPDDATQILAQVAQLQATSR